MSAEVAVLAPMTAEGAVDTGQAPVRTGTIFLVRLSATCHSRSLCASQASSQENGQVDCDSLTLVSF